MICLSTTLPSPPDPYYPPAFPFFSPTRFVMVLTLWKSSHSIATRLLTNCSLCCHWCRRRRREVKLHQRRLHIALAHFPVVSRSWKSFSLSLSLLTHSFFPSFFLISFIAITHTFSPSFLFLSCLSACFVVPLSPWKEFSSQAFRAHVSVESCWPPYLYNFTQSQQARLLRGLLVNTKRKTNEKKRKTRGEWETEGGENKIKHCPHFPKKCSYCMRLFMLYM